MNCHGMVYDCRNVPSQVLSMWKEFVFMGFYNRDDDYKWFMENQKELFKIYPNKFLIISGKQALGSFETFDAAMEEALKKMKAGEFLIQQCTEDTSPIQYFNRAVFFR